MHSALLVDEIIRLIFENTLNDDKASLCVAARCCQAWKDPALDCIWRRLPSAIPLLSLLPGFSMENGNIRLGTIPQDLSSTVFCSYATRVKHINHSHRILADLASIPKHLARQLGNLESVRIESGAIGEPALHASLAPRLRTLALQFGYAKSRSTTTSARDIIALLQGCGSLERLSVRGHASDCPHAPLGGLASLRSLSLHLSCLTEPTLMAVSALPLLADLDVHADRLSPGHLSAAAARACDDGAFFPALERLKIRAEPALVASVVHRLPRDKLRSLHVDAAGSAPPSAFGGLFRAMATLSLHAFTLEQGPVDDADYAPPDAFCLEHLRPLSTLPLRRFVLDVALPPDLSDASIEEMARWWPRLDRLELGARTALENVKATWRSGCSLASLSTLARGCGHLKSLVITLDVGSVLAPADLGHVGHPLTSLTISSGSRPDVSSLCTLLARLFPSLMDVTPGFASEHEEAWVAVQATLSKYTH